jgi:Nickel responsive protein SCO4226-like
MNEFLVELYVSKTSGGAVAAGEECLGAAAAELTAEGRPVRLVRSIFVPEDETCFLLVDATSAEDVREAARRAALTIDRVVETAADAGGDGEPAPSWRFPGPTLTWTRPDAWTTEKR